MKRFIAIALIICFALSLCACADSAGGAVSGGALPASPIPNPDDTMTYPVESGDKPYIDRPTPTPPTESAESSTAPEETAVPMVEQPSPTPEAPVSKFPYTLRIDNPAQGIYKDPSYDSAKVGMVITATVYTITEEATDDEGILWGKLKSGAGWVDLDSIYSFDGKIPLVTVNFADLSRIKEPYESYYPTERYEWATLADIRVTAPVTNVKLLMLEPLEYTVYEEYCYLSGLDAMQSFVTELYFSGDFTTYGLSLIDEYGIERIFAIGQSGRNGELVVREITGNI